MRMILLTALGLIFVACGTGQSPSFVVGENTEGANDQKAEKSEDALAEAKGSDQKNNIRTANFGKAQGAEGKPKDKTPPTVEQVIASCESGEILEVSQVITFSSQTGCEWGSSVGGNEVLSAKGNLSEKNNWIRAIEEKTKSVSVPADAIVCGIDLKSQTSEIHFDDFFALRLNQYIAAGSKVLTDALSSDADGHRIWNWASIRGDGSEASGTMMQNSGKYCGTGACELPNHDTPGTFNVEMSLDDNSSGALMNAKLFAKLSNQSKIDLTMTATGDNDDYMSQTNANGDVVQVKRTPGECYHSGGSFDFKLKYVKK